MRARFLSVTFWGSLMGGCTLLFPVVRSWIPTHSSFLLARNDLTNRRGGKGRTTFFAPSGHHRMSKQEVSELSDKDIYQRVFHRLTPGSAVDVYNALVVEERVRFQPDPTRDDGYILPVGPTTLILRGGKVKDGEIGKEIFRLDVQDGREKHNGFGLFDNTVATILYLASNPKLLKGNVLELGCDLGLASLLACIGLGGFEDKNNNKQPEPEVVDILTIPKTTPVTNGLGKITLSTEGRDQLDFIVANVKASNVPSSKINIEVLDWTQRQRNRGGGSSSLYKTIVGSDLDLTYPKARELARTAAHRLQGTASWELEGRNGYQPTFVHVAPDTLDETTYLRRFLEKGFRMRLNAVDGYLKVERLVFVFQMLPRGTPEDALEDEEIEVQDVKEEVYQCLTAFHSPEYADGAGEIFFPLETGEYEASGGNSNLEPEAGSAF